MNAMRFLVTAGNTRETIDRVRDWGNIFTGNTGYGIARALGSLGQVELLTSNLQHVEQACVDGIAATAFRSHADLCNLLERRVTTQRYDAIFMTAAVADYKPAGSYQVVSRMMLGEGSEQWTVKSVQAGKVKSNYDTIAVLGERTEKLVDQFRSKWGYSGLLFKFKLEVDVSHDDLIRNGQQSRIASDADYLVANLLDMVDGPGAGAYVLSEKGAEFVARAQLADKLVTIVKSTKGSTP